VTVEERQFLAHAKLAVIGCGNMGGALVRGLCSKGAIRSSQVRIYDPDSGKTVELCKQLGVVAAQDAASAVGGADIILVAVKPKFVAEVLGGVSNVIASTGISPFVMSVAGGVTLAELRRALGDGCRIIRAMPNLPVLAGAGMTAVYAESPEDRHMGKALFEAVGKVIMVENEAEFAQITGLSGCGPGFVSVIIEALADGGVRMGLARERATQLAVQTVLGTALVMAEMKIHPAELKDMVASPGGVTIAGLQVLENRGLRGALISAVEASTQKPVER